ncbi:MAG: VPLPA-CTERM sorting domain-containing protein [Phycisphaerales bacterium]|nr:VPLPA-CTERM sorting domain-containing protein [Phycisphaerales bacterium]
MSSTTVWAAAIAVAGVAGLAGASQTATFSDGPGDVGGGEFTAVTSDHGTFKTFCLEYYEPLDIFGGTVYEYTISTEAMYDGGGLGNTDPLDSRSAFIFQRFVDGQIRNLLNDQGLSDTRVANAVQIALWDVEQEGVNFTFHPDYANSQALIAAANTAIGNGSWSGLGNVRVMNNWVQGLVGNPDGARQDTLIIVPLPSAAAFAGVGLIGLATLRRRK